MVSFTNAIHKSYITFAYGACKLFIYTTKLFDGPALLCEIRCVVVLSMLPSLTMTKQQMKKSVQVVTLKAVDEFADAPFWESML